MNKYKSMFANRFNVSVLREGHRPSPTIETNFLGVGEGFKPSHLNQTQRQKIQYKLLFLIAVLVCLMAGCGTPQQAIIEREFPQQADAKAGRQHIMDYGCGACHTIEGIRTANGVVGAPLVDYESQHYIAGELPNNAVNLARWIQNPQEIEPDTAMPNLGVSYAEAMDIVAYFYSR